MVLALETSSTMGEGDNWRWIQKAAHRFLRHQVPVNSALALITFSGRRVTLEQPLIQVTSHYLSSNINFHLLAGDQPGGESKTGRHNPRQVPPLPGLNSSLYCLRRSGDR